MQPWGRRWESPQSFLHWISVSQGGTFFRQALPPSRFPLPTLCSPPPVSPLCLLSPPCAFVRWSTSPGRGKGPYSWSMTQSGSASCGQRTTCCPPPIEPSQWLLQVKVDPPVHIQTHTLVTQIHTHTYIRLTHTLDRHTHTHTHTHTYIRHTYSRDTLSHTLDTHTHSLSLSHTQTRTHTHTHTH